MEDDPPEQLNQDFGTPKVLVFSFDTKQEQSDFISELFSFQTDKAHFSLSIEKKNTCSILLFGFDLKAIEESENTIKQIVYNLHHLEKNKWWFWKRDRSK